MNRIDLLRRIIVYIAQQHNMRDVIYDTPGVPILSCLSIKINYILRITYSMLELVTIGSL